MIRFWFFKILIIIGICIGAFFIPNQGFALSKLLIKRKIIFNQIKFSLALMIIGSICGFIFILIQLILLIDFAHR